MKNIVIRKKTKQLQEKARLKALKEFKDVKRIAILFDGVDFLQADAFRKELEAMGKVVRCWSYAEVDSPEWEYSPVYRFLTRRHLNFLRMPKCYIQDDFLGFPADMLMNLSMSHHEVPEYMAMLSQADFRVSFQADRAKYYDFVLALSAEQMDFKENADNLLFYLKNLRLK